MFISRLFIKNFRNLRRLDVEIEQGVTCFIGENNSGKTNIFHAIRLVLDGNRLLDQAEQVVLRERAVMLPFLLVSLTLIASVLLSICRRRRWVG
jgi:recombinational DNA repair ATPase RecF